MKAKVTGVEPRTSHKGGMFYHVFFKGEDDKSYLTHAYPLFKNKPMRNFKLWGEVIKRFKDGQDVYVDDLKIYKGTLLDADSGRLC